MANSEQKTKKQQFLKQFLQNQKRIYYYILMLVPNMADADDIMQQSAEIMWNKFEQFQPGTNFVAWANRIAYNNILHLKRSKARSFVSFIDEMGDIAENVAVEPQNEENLAILRTCLGKLNEKDRQIIELRYENDMAINKIAEYVSRPAQGMYKAMARIHNKLVQCVDRHINRSEHELE